MVHGTSKLLEMMLQVVDDDMMLRHSRQLTYLYHKKDIRYYRGYP